MDCTIWEQRSSTIRLKNATNRVEPNKLVYGCGLLSLASPICSLIAVVLRNEVTGHLATVEDMARLISTMIPMQVLADIDNSRNPMQLTRERLERAATENQFMNGKIAALDVSCL